MSEMCASLVMLNVCALFLRFKSHWFIPGRPSLLVSGAAAAALARCHTELRALAWMCTTNVAIHHDNTVETPWLINECLTRLCARARCCSAVVLLWCSRLRRHKRQDASTTLGH